MDRTAREAFPNLYQIAGLAARGEIWVASDFEIGLDTLMWGTDYPHPEGTWPHTKKMMIETLHGLPDEHIAKILGTNAAEFYGFDVKEFEPLVERIGPAVIMVMTMAAGLGIVAGYHREKTESLIPAIIIHGLFNIGGAIPMWLLTYLFA